MSTIFSERLFRRFEDQFRPFLERVGIPAAVLTQHDVEVEDTKYVELLETVAREANPTIGLDMGNAVELRDLGVLGHAMAASPNIGEALEIFARYLYVFSQSNTVRLDVAKRQAVCTYSVSILQPDLVRQDAEFALSFVTHGIFRLTERRVTPHLIEFSHTRLPEARKHEKFFGCEVAFGRVANRIHFNRDVLEAPLLSQDAGLLAALKFFLDDRLVTRSEEEDVVVKTRHLISTSLTHGIPTLDIVAERMGLSGRSLQRRLAERNLQFSDLVEAICKQISIDYVNNTEYPLTDIALMVGYHELSAFSRAFRRWTGKSPSQFRNR
jgi:AraC-like DNA-binding protein